jgi:hypothetical protein
MRESKTMDALKRMTFLYEWFSAEKAASFYTYLNDLPDDVVAKAIDELIKTSDRTPPVSMIRRKAESLMKTAKGIKPVNVSERWTEYLKAVKSRKGWGVQPHFKDKAMEIAAESVPADEIGRATNRELSILRSQFTKAYEEASCNLQEEQSNEKAVQEVKQRKMIPKSETKALPGGFYGVMP